MRMGVPECMGAVCSVTHTSACMHTRRSPRAFLLKGFLSDEECDHIKNKVHDAVSVRQSARLHTGTDRALSMHASMPP